MRAAWKYQKLESTQSTVKGQRWLSVVKLGSFPMESDSLQFDWYQPTTESLPGGYQALIFPQLLWKLHIRTLKLQQEGHKLGLVRVCVQKEAWIFPQSFTPLWHTFLILVIAWIVNVIVIRIVIVFFPISQVSNPEDKLTKLWSVSFTHPIFAETKGLSSCPLTFLLALSLILLSILKDTSHIRPPLRIGVNSNSDYLRARNWGSEE